MRTIAALLANAEGAAVGVRSFWQALGIEDRLMSTDFTSSFNSIAILAGG
jgi:hypothetical protein